MTGGLDSVMTATPSRPTSSVAVGAIAQSGKAERSKGRLSLTLSLSLSLFLRARARRMFCGEGVCLMETLVCYRSEQCLCVCACACRVRGIKKSGGGGGGGCRSAPRQQNHPPTRRDHHHPRLRHFSIFVVCHMSGFVFPPV